MYKIAAITVLSSLLFFTACMPLFIPVVPLPRPKHIAVWVQGHPHQHHHHAPGGWRHKHWRHH